MTLAAFWDGDWQAVCTQHDANSTDPASWLRLAMAQHLLGVPADAALAASLSLGATPEDATTSNTVAAVLLLAQASLLSDMEDPALSLINQVLPSWIEPPQRMEQCRAIARRLLFQDSVRQDPEVLPSRSLFEASYSSRVNRSFDSLSAVSLIRTIHHMACTGGTVISKCLAVMPNVALLSEVNPLNRYGSAFEPTNPLLLLERSYRSLTTDEIKEDFVMQIAQVMKICCQDGKDLVIRDHSHTDFCVGDKPSGITPVRSFLADSFPLVSAITVRHPIDSYLGLLAQGWHSQFQPSTLDEYSRRYMVFLHCYQGLPCFRYEEFCVRPEPFMAELCGTLQVNYSPDFIDRFGSVHLSGDSGRVSTTSISPRARRDVPERVAREAESSTAFRELIDFLEYQY
jgi:hypothetical protein